MKISHYIIISIFLISATIYLTRLLPFLVFRKKKPPAIFNYFEKNIPPMILIFLIIYSLKDIKITSAPFGIIEILSIAVVIIIHLWKRNALLSIFCGTIIYIIGINFIIK